MGRSMDIGRMWWIVRRRVNTGSHGPEVDIAIGIDILRVIVNGPKKKQGDKWNRRIFMTYCKMRYFF